VKQLTDEEAKQYTLKNILGDWEVGSKMNNGE